MVGRALCGISLRRIERCPMTLHIDDERAYELYTYARELLDEVNNQLSELDERKERLRKVQDRALDLVWALENLTKGFPA